MSSTTVGIVPASQQGALGNVRPQADRVRSGGHDAHRVNADIVTDLQNQIDKLLGFLSAFSVTIPAPTPTSAGIALDHHTITANTTINAPVLPSATVSLLVVFVTYSTGGWALTWNPSHFSVAPTGLSSLAGKKSIVIFADDGAGKWELAAPPMTGR